ncbi:MAG: extensin-like domain-containing protein [Hasllibacter sp.]
MRALALAGLLAVAGCGWADAPERSPRPEGRGVLGLLPFVGGTDEPALPAGLFGIPGLIGEEIGAVPGNGRCGIDRAYRVRSVGGVQLSSPARMNEVTARALNTWVRSSLQPTFGQRVVRMRMAAGYVCRTRNHRPGARLSEHSFGRAIDLASFTLDDGTIVTVLNGWNDPEWRDELRTVWRGACGPFGTVLGPNADAAHRDHFHFDTAAYRSGSYCR